MITQQILEQVCPKTKKEVLAKYVDAINEIGKHYDMFANTNRIAGFIAQIAHESGGFNFVKENLNYSKEGLRKVFPKYFPDDATAEKYARQPEKIANRIYANRMGNGDEASGDGFKFCGRGLIQLTGKENYTNFAKAMDMTLDEAVKHLETPEGAVASAGWFWNSRKLNEFCDKGDFVTLTKRINGGTIGLEDRQHHYKIVLEALKA